MANLSTAVVRRRIKSLEFGMYTDEEVRARSVIEITSPVTYDSLNTPLPRGLYDPHLGPTEKHGGSCITCGNPPDFCPGHFGHIELCVPLYHPLIFPKLVQLMRCKCLNCHDFKIGKVTAKTYMAKIALIESGKSIDAIQLDAKLKDVKTKYAQKKSMEDENQYLSKIIEKYSKNTSTRSNILLTSHERTIQRDTIKAFITDCLARKTCANCNACSPNVRQDAHNKLFQSPLNQKQKIINLAEGIKLKAALSQNEKDNLTSGYTSDDSVAEPSGEGLTGGDIFTSEEPDDISIDENESKDKYMHALEVEAQLKLTWRMQPYLCSRAFALSHTNNKSPAKGYTVFFVRAVAVPPSRFRPPMVLGTMTAEHSQNLNLTKVLELNHNIRTMFASIALISEEVEDDETSVDAQNRQEERDDLQQKCISTWINLQTVINTFYDSSKSDDDRAPNGIRQLLEKKEGMFRKNIMGKRVNYACRSVISPDPYIGTNEIGIPVKFAKKLTYPTPVNALNVEEMRKLVVRGPHEYPGAVWVEEMATQRRFDLTRMSQLKREAVAARLLSPHSQTRIGRQLRNGDMMLLNRQPTLHKPGIMAHTVRILHNPTQQTIRMHYANCNTYNADFDGDEMNAHFPQNDIARAESQCILSTDLQYIVPTDGSPLRGLIQDHVDSGVKLTKLDTFLEKWEYQQLLFAALASLPGLEVIRSDSSIQMVPPAIRKPKELWTGKQVITTLLHHLRRGNDRDDIDQSCTSTHLLPGINIERKTKTPGTAFGESYQEHKVLIRDGELLRGVLDKAAFGSTDFSLVHAVYEAYGPNKAGLLLNSLGRLFTAYLQYYSGHSCRMEDLILTSEADNVRKDLVKQSYNLGTQAAKAWADSEGGKNEIVEDLKNEPLTPFESVSTAKKIGQLLSGKEGPHNSASFDSYMQGKMNPLASNIIKACLPNGLAVPFPANTFGLMVTTGAKGSTVNQSQVSCSLGQQALEGRRVPRMPSGRTLPSFAPYDPNPRADGFIADRFLTGVRPQEYYFHCMAGREGLVDTAVKTSRSGYLQRCLVKHLEELKVCYDSTVRDAEGGVVQFLYGEDGIDPTKAAHLDCSSSTLEYIARNKVALERKYKALPNSSIDVAFQDYKRAQSVLNDDPSELMKVGDFVHARKLRYGNSWERGALLNGWYNATVAKVHSNGSLDIKYQKDGTIAKNVPIETKFAGCGGRKTKALSSIFTLIKAAIPDPILSDVTRPDGPHRLGSSGLCVSERVAKETHEALSNDSKLKEALSRTNISPSEFGKIVASKYGSALCAPGEAVGSIAAQSIGEPSTQMTLNTFHLAGSGANVTLGIPRLREIIMTASRNLKTPTMSVPVDKSLSERELTRLARLFKKVTLMELISNKSGITVKEALEQSDNGSWERAYYITLKFHPAERIEEAFGLNLKDIANVVSQSLLALLTKAMKKEYAKASIDGKTSNFQIAGGESDMDLEEVTKKPMSEIKKAKKRQKESEEYETEGIDLEDGVQAARLGHRKEMATYEGMDDEEKELSKEITQEYDQLEPFDYGLDNIATVTDDESDDGKGNDFRTIGTVKVNKKDNTILIPPLRVDPAAQPLLMVGLVEEAANKTVVRSLKGIDEAFINDEDGRGKCLQTAGCNFEVLWKLENVNHRELLSNDIWAVRCAYGVEAARRTIVDQIRGVFAVYGISVDPRHLSLIADSMTYDGGFKAMNRVGMITSSSGFLKMSFETTANFLLEAALNNHAEALTSPSANIVVGNPIKHGTGAFECIMKG